jgi:hypothetical protein
MNIDQQHIQWGPSQNQLMVGKKGPLWGRLVLDFSAAPTYHLDIQNAQALNQFDLCQTIFIDNSAGGDSVSVSIPATGQVIKCKAGQQGYFNVVCPNPIVMDFSSNGGAVATFLLLNVAIPGAVWSAV